MILPTAFRCLLFHKLALVPVVTRAHILHTLTHNTPAEEKKTHTQERPVYLCSGRAVLRLLALHLSTGAVWTTSTIATTEDADKGNSRINGDCDEGGISLAKYIYSEAHNRYYDNIQEELQLFDTNVVCIHPVSRTTYTCSGCDVTGTVSDHNHHSAVS